jgi:hypothetical protein
VSIFVTTLMVPFCPLSIILGGCNLIELFYILIFWFSFSAYGFDVLFQKLDLRHLKKVTQCALIIPRNYRIRADEEVV